MDSCLPVCPRKGKKGISAKMCILYLIDKYMHLDSRLRGNDRFGTFLDTLLRRNDKIGSDF